MSSVIRQTQIADGTTERAVSATIVELSPEEAARWIDEQWWLPHVDTSPHGKDKDRHWSWSATLRHIQNEDVSEIVEAAALVVESDKAEGAIVMVPAPEGKLSDGRPTVYIERLATAPWNRPWLATPPKHRGVGTGLLLHAIWESRRLGYGGRVTLSTLRSKPTAQFYEKLGFAATPWVDNEGLPVLELSPEQADRILSRHGIHT